MSGDFSWLSAWAAQSGFDWHQAGPAGPCASTALGALLGVGCSAGQAPGVVSRWVPPGGTFGGITASHQPAGPSSASPAGPSSALPSSGTYSDPGVVAGPISARPTCSPPGPSSASPSSGGMFAGWPEPSAGFSVAWPRGRGTLSVDSGPGPAAGEPKRPWGSSRVASTPSSSVSKASGVVGSAGPWRWANRLTSLIAKIAMTLSPFDWISRRADDSPSSFVVVVAARAAPP
jgi:hypothetical protein